MSFSIRETILQYGSTLDRVWEHDRSQTAGGSEIGACIRKTWFSKHAAPRDPDYQESWGATTRGNLIENHFWLPALRACLPADVRLLYAGEEQTTLKSGYLSATTDGLLVWPNGYCIDLDCKSIDPRVNLQKEKAEHSFQVQAQMGLIRECTEHKPEIAILSYINASFFDDVSEYVVNWNPRIYAAAHERAERIITAIDPLSLEPEGKISGGNECKWCAWQSHCAEVSVAGVPAKDAPTLDAANVEALHRMRDEVLAQEVSSDAYAAEAASGRERIKQFLRDHNSRGHRGDGWAVNYSVTGGRQTLDMAAIEKAGIDLSDYYKSGKGGERLVLK